MNNSPTKQLSKLLPALALAFGFLAPMQASASIVEECFENQCTVVYGYTGQIEPLTFPENASNVRFEVLGAQGGKNGGGGGRVTGTFIEVPETLYITVGGAGGSNSFEPGGFNGGGDSGGSGGVEGSGGGGSDIRTGYSLSSRIIVAGGGGGRGSGFGSGGGAGGGLIGAAGKTGQGTGGQGGSQEAGGIGGAPFGQGSSGSQGDWGVGGAGGSGPLHGGGGGGGGFFGGGGGGPDEDSCCTDAGGGGGGSSYADASLVTDVEHTQGVRPGAGQITFVYQLAAQSEPTPPVIETTPTPEPTTPEPASPKPEPDAVSPPGPSPAPPETAGPKPFPSESANVPKVAEDVPALISEEAIPEKPPVADYGQITVLPEALEIKPETPALDEIVQQGEKLRQAAQTVVVPAQSRQQPFSSNTLFAGVVGLAVFAMIAGLVVARRGVPGVIAS